jgi:hypothetical protein
MLPRIRGPFRVPFPTNFIVLKTSSYFGGTEFTLAWVDQTGLVNYVDHYKIYAQNLLATNQEPTFVGSSKQSPCTVKVSSSEASVVVFYIQTVLKNGYANNALESPTCTGNTIAPKLSGTDIPNGALDPGKLAWRVKNITSSEAFDSALYDYYVVSITSSDITVTLPTVASCPRLIGVKRLGTGTKIVKLVGSGGQTVNGASELDILNNNSAVLLMPYGTNWNVT